MIQLVVASLGFGFVTASIVALAGVGFTMQFGITNIPNLAYGSIMTAAAFVVYYINRAGVDVWLCMPIGALVGGVGSVLLNRVIYARFVRRGAGLLSMIIVALGVGVIIENVILAIGGSGSYNYHVAVGPSVDLGPMVFTLSQFGIMALALAAMASLHLILTRTRLGKAMRATANDASLARACGIDTARMVDIAWALSGVLCGLAGVTLVANTNSFDSTTGDTFIIVILAAVMLGGVGQPYGAMLGALITGVVIEVSAVFIDPQYKDVVAFVILIGVIVFAPRGILGHIDIERDVAM